MNKLSKRGKIVSHSTNIHPHPLSAFHLFVHMELYEHKRLEFKHVTMMMMINMMVIKMMMLMTNILIEADDRYWRWKRQTISSVKRRLPPKRGSRSFSIFTMMICREIHISQSAMMICTEIY